MQIDDMIMISVDDHVVEPPDMFERHLPARWHDIAPRVERRDDGSDVWVYDGNEIPNIGLNAVAGRPPDEYGMEPTSFEEIRSGCYDLDDRVRDMDANGVLGSMCFPSFPNLCGQLFSRSSDLDAGLAVLSAYNDWHIDEWCGGAPGRFIPLMLPPIWDPDAMAAEVRRNAAKGCHAVSFSENPSHLKLPSFHDAHWDPFWQACSDEGTIVCLHIGSSSRLVVTARDAPIDVLITLQPINIVQAAADLLWSPVLRKFPDLQVALSEGGIGWIPYFCDRVDWIYTRHHQWTGQDFGGHLPSEMFLDRVVLCFIDDPAGVANLDRMNVDRICWESDYPHSDSTWPISPETLWPAVKDLPDSLINKITYENAMQHFRFDPFRDRERVTSTVGALRAQSQDVDVTPRSVAPRLERKTGVADLIGTADPGEALTDPGRRAVIVGAATSDYPVLPDRAETEVHVQAAERALADAGLTFDDVDGYATVGYHPMYCVGMCEYLGIHPHWLDETNIGGASFEVHVEHAARAVEAGACEVVLITYGSVQLSAMGRRIGGRGGTLSGHQAWDAIWGNTLVGAYALAATRHMFKYGTTAEQLAEIAVTFRRHAGFNPSAQYRDPITVDDVISSRMVADPLHMLDCCVVSDGGGACVVTTEERARDLPGRPIYVLGAAHTLTHALNLSQSDDLTVTAAARSAPLALQHAGVTLADVDVLQLYDSFTITVLLTLEDLGFCAKGEGGAFVENGRLAFDGPLPTNTDGGGLSACHPGMRGMFLIVEAVRQLRGQAGPTQVPDAKIALAHGTGGMLSTGATLLLGTEAP